MGVRVCVCTSIPIWHRSIARRNGHSSHHHRFFHLTSRLPRVSKDVIWYLALAAPSLPSRLFLPRYLPVACYLACYYPTLLPAPADCPSPRSSVMQRGERTLAKCAGRHPTEEKIRIRGHFAHSRIHPFTHSPNPPIHPSVLPSINSSIHPLIHSSLPHLSFRVCARSSWYHRACNEDAGTKNAKMVKVL